MFGFIKSKKVFLAILRIENTAERMAIGYEIFGRKFNDMLESHHIDICRKLPLTEGRTLRAVKNYNNVKPIKPPPHG